MKSAVIFEHERHGLACLLSYRFIILSTLAFVTYFVYDNLPSSGSGDLRKMWKDLSNGTPKRGEAGLGRFLIYGETTPFEYGWRLASRYAWSASTPWLCYIPHQLAQFYIIYKARDAKLKGDLQWTDSSTWNPFAWNMFKLNTFFIVLHYFQTKYFYDGLAQTFTEIGTLMLCAALIMAPFMFAIRRRGFFFGWTPAGWKNALFEFSTFARQYHGYLCSFGMTLTFWYHPMEATFSHWTGFGHIILLFWQSSMIYQQSHRNRYWTFLLEFLIVIHGAVVAYFQGLLEGKLYLMFMTGLMLTMISSQIWSLPIVRSFVNGKHSGVDGNDGEIKLFTWKYWLVVLSTVIPWFGWTVYEYASNGVLYLIGMPFGIPITYYLITAYFFYSFRLSKLAEQWLVGKWGLKRDSQMWFFVLGLFGAISCAVLMGGSEAIYRIFVPYSKPVPHDFVINNK